MGCGEAKEDRLAPRGRPIVDGRKPSESVEVHSNGSKTEFRPTDTKLSSDGDAGVLTGQDLERLDEIRRHRNEIAHELATFLVEESKEVQLDLLRDMRELIRKVDTWWILSIEVPANEEFDDVEVTEEDVQSGQVLFLDLLLSVAVYGYEESEDQVRERFEKLRRGRNSKASQHQC